MIPLISKVYLPFVDMESEFVHACIIAFTTLAVQIALWQSVISFTKITYHTAKIFREISGKNNEVFLFLIQLIRYNFDK